MGGHVGGQQIHRPAPAKARHLHGWAGWRRVLLAQLFDHVFHAGQHAQAVLGGGHGAVRAGGQAQRAQAHGVVEHQRRFVVGQLNGQVGRLFHITGQQALVQPRGLVQRAFAAQQHRQKLKLRQVMAQHQQHDGDGGGQHQPDGAPDGRPEHGGHDQRQRGHAGAGAVKPGLDDVVADQLQRDDQRQGPQHHAPAWVHREGQRQRKDGRNHRPHVRHKAQHRRQQAPHQRARYGDEQQPHGQRYAVGGVDQQLHRQILADALARVAQRIGGAVQVGAQKPHGAVAQIALVQQDQHHEDKDDARHRQRRGHRVQPAQRTLHGGRRLADQLNLLWGAGARGRRGRALGWVDLALEPVHHARVTVEHAGLAQGFAQGAHLLVDIGFVGGQVAGQLPQLAVHEPAGAGQQRHGRRHHHHDRHRPGQAAPLEPRHHRVQHEAQQRRQRQRHQHVAPKIKRRHDDGAAHQAIHQRLPGWRGRPCGRGRVDGVGGRQHRRRVGAEWVWHVSMGSGA